MLIKGLNGSKNIYKEHTLQGLLQERQKLFKRSNFWVVVIKKKEIFRKMAPNLPTKTRFLSSNKKRRPKVLKIGHIFKKGVLTEHDFVDPLPLLLRKVCSEHTVE